MTGNFVDDVHNLVLKHGDNALVCALEVQKYVNSIVLDNRLAIANTRREGYAVGWNSCNDALVVAICSKRKGTEDKFSNED